MVRGDARHDLDVPSMRHGTGHGIGLEVHEPILLDEGGGKILIPGEVFTVEPGLYSASDRRGSGRGHGRCDRRGPRNPGTDPRGIGLGLMGRSLLWGGRSACRRRIWLGKKFGNRSGHRRQGNSRNLLIINISVVSLDTGVDSARFG